MSKNDEPTALACGCLVALLLLLAALFGIGLALGEAIVRSLVG